MSSSAVTSTRTTLTDKDFAQYIIEDDGKSSELSVPSLNLELKMKEVDPNAKCESKLDAAAKLEEAAAKAAKDLLRWDYTQNGADWI